MKTWTFKELVLETYIDIIFCLIGLVALYALCDQIHVLGFGVFNAEPQKAVATAKTERNITNLLLFAVVSVSGIVYGVVGIFKSFTRLNKNRDTSRLTGTD
ncbi:MAG: hypothetical protein PHU23_18010 [Dehalococcoidales bacterium]|nr:hypothetical protein [Dehalococcoidales bacterium]